MTTDEKLRFIFGRRSIRAFTRDPVGDEAFHKLLEAAMAAPSAAACNTCGSGLKFKRCCGRG